MDESQLVSAAKSGDLPAFNQLVLNHQTLAYNVAYRIMGDPDLAADATQDSFIKAYKALHTFHGGAFKPWLLRIVTNTCYDYLRARKRKPTNSLDDAIESGSHQLRFRDSSEGPEDYVERRELNGIIQWAVEQLSEHQRAVVVLVDIEGFSYEETAAILSVSLGTVKSRLSRARAKLRDILQAHQELLPTRYRTPITEHA